MNPLRTLGGSNRDRSVAESGVSIRSVIQKCQLQLSVRGVDQKCRSKVSIRSVDQKCRSEGSIRSVVQKCRSKVERDDQNCQSEVLLIRSVDRKFRSEVSFRAFIKTSDVARDAPSCISQKCRSEVSITMNRSEVSVSSVAQKCRVSQKC